MEFVDFDEVTGRWLGHFLERLQRGKKVINPEEAAILNILRVYVDRQLLVRISQRKPVPPSPPPAYYGAGGCETR